MSILAIDTAGETASAAVVGLDGQIAEKMNTDSLDHLKSLMQLVSEALAEAGTDKQELESIAVTTGPGSFTGIRIGMAAARTLAQVLGIKVAPVMTLDAYCYHDYGMPEPFLLCPMTDARRENVFAAAYEMPERRKVVPEGLYSLEEYLEKLPDGRKVVCTGSGASQYEEAIQKMFRSDSVNSENGQPSATDQGVLEERDSLVFVEYRHHAASVLRCAMDQQKLVDFNDAEPVYLRKAEAEIKRKEGKLGLRARKKLQDERQKILDMPPEDEPVEYRTLSGENPEALKQLAELDALCFEKAWNEEAFRGDLLGPRDAVYEGAFNSAGQMIGFAGAVSVMDEAEINRVAVHPLYRARGIGGTCLDRVLKKLEDNGVANVFLEVREANRSAITLYKNNGFRVISKRKNYYQDTGENALIMQWKREEKTSQ